MTYGEEYLLRELAMRCRTTAYRDRVQQAILLRSARNPYEKARIRRMILDARASWMEYLTIQQRKWQASVSRRPKRGRNHDSWATRESYVQVQGSYTDFMAIGRKLGAKPWRVA